MNRKTTEPSKIEERQAVTAGWRGSPPLCGSFPFVLRTKKSTRADTAVRPYAEFIVVANIKSINLADQRDAGWDVEREGRETKVEQPTRAVPLCTGDFGTSVRHPPRERIY